MPSPRLFGFRPKKRRPAEPEPDREPDDLIATLAEKVIDEGNDVPKIAAWGISPAEK